MSTFFILCFYKYCLSFAIRVVILFFISFYIKIIFNRNNIILKDYFYLFSGTPIYGVQEKIVASPKLWMAMGRERDVEDLCPLLYPKDAPIVIFLKTKYAFKDPFSRLMDSDSRGPLGTTDVLEFNTFFSNPNHNFPSQKAREVAIDYYNEFLSAYSVSPLKLNYSDLYGIKAEQFLALRFKSVNCFQETILGKYGSYFSEAGLNFQAHRFTNSIPDIQCSGILKFRETGDLHTPDLLMRNLQTLSDLDIITPKIGLLSTMISLESRKYLDHNNMIELIWTLSPAGILWAIGIPSLKLLYIMDEILDAEITIKAIGNQWYWNYEYSDLTIQENEEGIYFDSFMIDVFWKLEI